MAKQTGAYKITGTYDDVTYYKMEEQYYARKKSSLKGERVKKDPRFQRTMEWAERLGRATQLASKVYRSLPRQEQVYALFCTLKSAAMRALKEGKEVEEVKGVLKTIISTMNKVQSTKGETRGTKNEGQGTRWEKLRAEKSCKLYAARKGCMVTKEVVPAGGRLLVDGAGKLIRVQGYKIRTAEGVAGPKRVRAQSP